MLCISVEETQKGKENYVTHHALINLLIERFLRDVSPLTWDEFVKTNTLQPQVGPSEQHNEENIAPTSELTEQNIQEVETKKTQGNEQETALVQENVPPPVQEIPKPNTKKAKRKQKLSEETSI